MLGLEDFRVQSLENSNSGRLGKHEDIHWVDHYGSYELSRHALYASFLF